MKIRPFGAELFHVDRRTDGWMGERTDMTKLIVALSQFCENAYKWQTLSFTGTIPLTLSETEESS